MSHLPFGQQGAELLPDGLDDVRWERGHKPSPSSGSLVTPRMIEHPVSAFHVWPSRPYSRRLLAGRFLAWRSRRIATALRMRPIANSKGLWRFLIPYLLFPLAHRDTSRLYKIISG